MENTKKEFKQERLALCKTCPQVKYTWGIGLTCGDYMRPISGVSCGCKLTWKCALKKQECPQGVWGKVEPETKKKILKK